MSRFQHIGGRSPAVENYWEGRIIDPNEKFDPHSDPRSVFAPAVLDGLGDCSASLTRGFLKDRICACWNLTSISPFFPLVNCNRTHYKAFLFRTTFTNLSIANSAILWRVAQKFSLEEASNEVGRALAKAYASYDGAVDGKGQARVEDEAFRILARRVDSIQNTTTTPSTTLQRELNVTAAQHIENDIESTGARVPGPAKSNFKSLTIESIANEFSNTEATNHLAQLVTGVEEAISRRDKFIVDQLHKEDAKIDKELSELLLEKRRHEKAEEAHLGIKKLGSYLDVLDDDGEPLPPHSGVRQALNALEDEIKKLGTKRNRDYESESAALRGKQKRIKAQVELLAQTECTFSASEDLLIYEE